MTYQIGYSNKSRLRDAAMDAFVAMGVIIPNDRDRLFWNAVTPSSALAFNAVSQRPGDIMMEVMRGDLVAGIVGRDQMAEFNLRQGDALMEIAELPGAQCWIKTGGEAAYFSDSGPALQALDGKRIAAPRACEQLIRQLFAKAGVTPRKFLFRDGAVEGTVPRGLADAIVDLVETGGTMRANNLVPGDILFESEAVLIARRDVAGYIGDYARAQPGVADKAEFVQMLTGRLQGARLQAA